MTKLIKKGQAGMYVNHTGPYNAEIYLEKDPLPEDYVEPKNVGKYGYIDIPAEARMDLTVQQLNETLSTYKPTKELLISNSGITHPFNWGEATTALPILLAGAPFVLEGLKAAGAAILSNPIGAAVELGKDMLTYTTADAASQGITGLRVADNFNKVLNLPEGHPVGELGGFTTTSLLRRPLEKAGVVTYRAIRGAALPEYALSQAMDLALWKPYVSRVVGENGKIRLRLPGHTDKAPSEVVVVPRGNNQFEVHIRTLEGSLSLWQIGQLYESLYNELPEGAEILFPESGPGYYAKRGTVAALQRLARDPRFSKGSPGTLLYIDKDGSIKEFTGTSFIKTPSLGKTIYDSNITPNQTLNLNIPSWTPISKNYDAHSNDYVTIESDKHGPVFTLKNSSGEILGDLALMQEKNGIFSVSNINSYKPGGSGPLYNAAIRYGQLRYGDAFKGIRSGDLLASAEQTTNVTNKFPAEQLPYKGAHFYGNEYRKGPVLLLTGLSSYYPTPNMPLIERLKTQLPIPERFGIPKGERGNLTLDLTEALSDLYQYITSGRFRQYFVSPDGNNFMWGTKSQGTPAYKVFLDAGIQARTDNLWFRAGLNTGNGHGTISYSPVLNTTSWAQGGFPKVTGMNWIPGEARMTPYDGGTYSVVFTPPNNELSVRLAEELKGNSEILTTVPKLVMRNFWRNASTFQRPGTYLSGDAGNSPLGFFLINDYKNNRLSGIYPIFNQQTLRATGRMGLSPDSFSSIIRQGNKNPLYELRWGEGFRNWNPSAVNNSDIYNAWLLWKNGKISLSEYESIFNLWSQRIGGRPLLTVTINGKQHPLHPHPFLYRKKKGGKLEIK